MPGSKASTLRPRRSTHNFSIFTQLVPPKEERDFCGLMERASLLGWFVVRLVVLGPSHAPSRMATFSSSFYFPTASQSHPSLAVSWQWKAAAGFLVTLIGATRGTSTVPPVAERHAKVYDHRRWRLGLDWPSCTDFGKVTVFFSRAPFNDSGGMCAAAAVAARG